LRSLSIARVATVGLGALALVALMLLGAFGVLGGEEQRARAVLTGLTDGRLPAHALDDDPNTTEESLPPNASPRMNLTGDEVSPALATYGIDRDGNLFEFHSPQTEEPKLGAPIG
jgi:hypothetical protein